MRQGIVLIISFIFIIVLIACGNTEVPDEEAAPFIKKGKQIVSLLNTKQYGELRKLFDIELLLKVSEKDLKNNESLIKNSGDFIEIELISVEREKNVFLVNLATKYSKEHRIYIIRFNQEVQVIELLVK